MPKSLATLLAPLPPLVLLCSWGLQQPDPKTPPPEEAPQPIEFPTFGPFQEARMFKLFAKDVDKVDLAKAAAQQKQIADIQKESREVAEKYGEQRSRETAGALLLPELENAARAQYSLVPVAMMQIEPLWKVEKWTTEHLARAASPLEYLGSIAGAPQLALKEGKDTENHVQLEKLVRWFDDQIAKPELYASMIITMDDGPFVGLPYAKTGVLEARSTAVLDEKTAMELHLCKDESLPEPWILQVVKAGKPLWTRVFSGSPRGTISEAELSKSTKHWPRYGWKAFLKIRWSYGSEMAYLYLSPKGELCFYFLTW